MPKTNLYETASGRIRLLKEFKFGQPSLQLLPTASNLCIAIRSLLRASVRLDRRCFGE